MYQIVDFFTKEPVTPKNLIFTGEDSPWEVMMDLEYVRRKINIDYFKKAPPQVTKYLPFLPIKYPSEFISMNEGATPLIKSKYISKIYGIDLYFKCEYQNPTGSFKDRGSAVELSVAKELKVKAISVASTGNMAASCSCYATSAKIPCFVFVPEDTPSGKLSQTISYGGKIVQIKGNYNDASKISETVAKDLDFYLAGDYAFRIEGQKTGAFELVDQLYYQAPDAVIIPMGCGTNIAAYAKGFDEYMQLGFIDKRPKLIGVQAEGAKAIVNSFEKGVTEIETLSKIDTISSAIAVTRPLDGTKALTGIYKSGGSAVSVSDRETLEAQYILSSEEGLFVESSSATSLAALIKLCKNGEKFSGKVVCILTGEGLKDPTPILRVAIKPPTINPNVEEFVNLYENAFFEGKTVSFVEKGQVLFSNIPSDEEVEICIKKHFKGIYTKKYSGKILTKIIQFLKKGKPITFSDFQDILQDVLESSSESSNILKVVDFAVSTGKDRKAEASVRVEIYNEEKSAISEGVGPVAAVLNALKNACGEKLSFTLANFEVVIRSNGSDAVVYTDIKLIREGKVSIGKGISPDVIQASIEAFEKAFNGLN